MALGVSGTPSPVRSDRIQNPRNQQNEMSNPVLHHVNLKTRRLQEMIDWYGLAVGMHSQHQFEGGAWLTNDAANHRLALLTTPGMEDDPDKIKHTGLHHTAFEFDSLDALLERYEGLRDSGHLPHACLDHGMTTSFYYVDPDGNSVELQSDNFGGDWVLSSAFLKTQAFIDDPIGTQIDPEKMLQARAAGASPEDVHDQGYAGSLAPDSPLDLRLP
jgi:catechol 2,3-dioxygenase